MDLIELKREQLRLAPKIVLRDGFSNLKTIGGISCAAAGKNIIACVVICEYPSMKLLETTFYELADPLPYQYSYEAYREMPAMIEAFNRLNQEPDLVLVDGTGILHPRKIGIASHIGLALNVPTIGMTDKLLLGREEKGKIILYNDIVGFEITTREHSLPLYVSPGHLVGLGTVLDVIQKMIQYPHKMPEPVHLAHKLAKKRVKGELSAKDE